MPVIAPLRSLLKHSMLTSKFKAKLRVSQLAETIKLIEIGLHCPVIKGILFYSGAIISTSTPRKEAA
jgi:hypothetical protein